MLGNIRVDGTPLNPQPSRFVPHAPQGSNPRAISGVYVPSAPDFGWWFEIVYGSSEVTDNESFTALSVLGSPGDLHDLTFEDAAGNDVTKIVCLMEEIVTPIHWGSLPERFSVSVYEAAESS